MMIGLGLDNPPTDPVHQDHPTNEIAGHHRRVTTPERLTRRR